MNYALGIDIGSVNVKAVLLGPDGRLLEARTRPLSEGPAAAIEALLEGMPVASPESTLRIGVTGCGRDLVQGRVRGESEVVALSRAVPMLFPGACAAIDIGGHGARYVQLDPKTGALLDYGLNQQCAAGSGMFFEEQAGRLQLSVEELSRLAAAAPRGATVAGRCSVFAKSDMIHLQQKGTPVAEIAYGLCLAMARNFVATVLRGRQVIPPLALAGGATSNPGLVRAFADVLKLSAQQLRMTPCAGCECAAGAALAALGDASLPEVSWSRVVRHLALSEPKTGTTKLPVLELDTVGVTEFVAPPAGEVKAWLGVDVGSVSTNLVLLGADGSVYEGLYLPTGGRPIDAIGKGLDQLRERFGERLRVLGVGVTGSGRHLAAHLLGADLVKNEITCQLRGAVEVEPEVDTIFEIGGQDSKYVRVRAGRIDDFVMNKICAAGTGSFLEEQAEHLGISIRGEFAGQAALSTMPADLGCQCTVFMHSELVAAQRRGAKTRDLTAGLAYSVARNYLDRVVAGRPVGDRVLFQGGVANNPAVVDAFRKILGKPVKVHPYAGVSGAIGAGHLVREAKPEQTAFRGLAACRDHQTSSFECKVCANRCQVNQILIEGHKVFFGDACERYASRVAGVSDNGAPDFMARWKALEESFLVPPAKPRGRIGIPRASALLDQLPFWAPFFRSLGFETVPSSPSSQATLQAGLSRLPAETCLPVKLAFGHVVELESLQVDRIFLPSILTRTGDDPKMSHSCPYVQAVPYMVRSTLAANFLTPEVDLSGGEEAFVAGMLPALTPLGVGRSEVVQAFREAQAAQAEFRRKIIEAGRQTLEGADRALVVIGKPYNVLDPYLNLNLFQHLRRLGVTALPMWALPFDDVELDRHSTHLPWQLNRAIIRAALYCERDDSFFPLLVSNFGCGPDAFTSKHLDEILEGRSALSLEFDEHRAEAGLVTRLEAFLDEINEPRRLASRHPVTEDSGCLTVTEGASSIARKSFIVPYISDHAYVLSGALRAAGHQSRVLPPPNPEILLKGEAFISGKECHPYMLLTADLANLAQAKRKTPEVFFYPGTTIPCLLHQYGDGQRLLLRRLGVTDLSVMNPSFEDYMELFGIDLGARIWRGLVAVDLLIKLQCETRPYELERGQTDEVHRQNIRDVESAIATDELSAALTMATSRLRLIPVDRSVVRPVVGVAGDIYTRINHVGNQNLFAWLEDQGCEVWPAPFLVDITDFSMRRDWAKGSLGEAALLGALMLRKNMESWRVKRVFRGKVKRVDEPGFEEVLSMASPYLGKQQNEVLVLNVAKMVDFALRGADGIINAGCFNCMLGTVSAAITGRLREDHGGIPIANLTYSGVEGSQLPTLEAFVHQVHTFAKQKARAAGNAAPPREKGLLARLWPN